MFVRNEQLELDMLNCLCVLYIYVYVCYICVHSYFMECILYVSSWYSLVCTICRTISLAQT